MRICLCCLQSGTRYLCNECEANLRPATPFLLPSGIRVSSGWAHEKTARRLVHLMKYQGLEAAAQVLAVRMASALPRDTAALVPVPRATMRRIRFGCDPAALLATKVASIAGIPVTAALRPGIWWPRHAGQPRGRRTAVRFRLIAPVVENAVLIDDVVTTGSTLSMASAATGLRLAVTATRAGSGPAR